MKTLTVRIYDPITRDEVAWVRMSSEWMLDDAIAEIGGPEADALNLPTKPSDISTLGCLAAAAAQEAGLDYTREWEGRWVLEHSIPEDDETEEPEDEDDDTP